MYIAFFNPQGNFDKNDSYWTEHPDFGGQLVYVKEVAIAMSKQGHKVDIFTRKICDPDWTEFKKEFDEYENVENVKILRMPCGPNNFLPKEELWPYLNEWVNNIIKYYKKQDRMPDFVTTHYGDGGLSGAIFKENLGIPFSFTSHSLGAQKMDKLGITEENFDTMDSKYKFSYRIYAERIAMLSSSIIFTSTVQERDEQYKHFLYKGAGDVYNPEKFRVVPPGANTSIFNDYKNDENDIKIKEYIYKMLYRDLNEDRISMPSIISSSRLDPKKNHIALVEAYAKSSELQNNANLVIILRGLKNPLEDYSQAKEGEKEILDKIIKYIKQYKLKGKVSIFSINNQNDLASAYRTFGKTHSIFALTSVYEPFGLAPIEAAACGLPVVVTKFGGPVDVLYENGEKYGVLIDVFNIKDIERGILEAFKNYDFYKKQGIKRVKSKYTWDATARGYIDAIQSIKQDYSNNIQIPAEFKKIFKQNPFKDWLKEKYFSK